MRQALREREPGELVEREPRPARELRGEAAFLPLRADVSPQMTLLGVPAPAPAPTFERRAVLRAERHRLASEVRRAGGGSHHRVNAWLNRTLDLRSVEHASLAQLERSIELLLDSWPSSARSGRAASMITCVCAKAPSA